MSWSPQQDRAIADVRRWLADSSGPQVFRLFGYAGSGKTTLAKHLAEDVKGTVLFGAFTGKAALVLRTKGCDGASTIHSMIYQPHEDVVTGETQFVLNEDSAVATAALVVIDEVSMVGEELARDLLSFGTRVLVLGDPAQLPPVKGEGFFINAEPDVMLTEVHRQAAENPIIRMSMDIREGIGLDQGSYGESQVVRRRSVDKDWMRDRVLEADQLLCGLNRTRQTFNARVRDIRGISGQRNPLHPAPGDRLVCLRNDRERGLLNGGLWTAEKVSPSGGPANPIDMRVQSLDGAGAVNVQVPEAFFLGGDKDLDWRVRRKLSEFTFGYCLTVHKAQGSQWDDVLIFDESPVFREDASKWLYTAVTRAADRVTVVV